MSPRVVEFFGRLASFSHLALVARSAFVVLLGHLSIRLGGRVIDGMGLPGRPDSEDQVRRRARTVRRMLKSVLRFTVDAVVILVILDLIGIETKSILAGAGIVGVVLGFGSQNLIRDLISGVFIVYEDQFNVGDYVTTASVEGVVEDMGLTVVRIRDFTGDLHFVRYGSVDRVTNHSRGKMRAWVDVPVSNKEEPQRVIDALAEACRSVGERSADAGEGPHVLGITSLDGHRIVYTVIGKADPGRQWALEREIRKTIAEVFHRLGIEPPAACYVRLSPEDAGNAGVI